MQLGWVGFLKNQNLVVVEDGVQSVGNGDDGAER